MRILVYVLGFALAAPVLGGALRYELGISLTTALGFGFAFAFASLYALASIDRRGVDDIQATHRTKEYLTVIWVLAFGALGIWIFCRPTVLVALGSLDAATHIGFNVEFSSVTPKMYFGFVGFYAASYFFQELLGGDVMGGMAAAGLLAVFLVHTLSMIVFIEGMPRTTNAKVWGLICLLLFGYSYFGVTGSNLHYALGEGFFAHAFSLGAALWTMAMVFLSRTHVAAIAAIVLGAVMWRYSYGLNVGDTALALGAVLLSVWFGFGRRMRHVFFNRYRLLVSLAGMACVVVGLVSYFKLWSVHSLSGGIAAPKMAAVERGLWYAILTFASWLLLVEKEVLSTKHSQWQVTIWSTTIVGCSAIIVSLCSFFGADATYYLYKYVVAAALISASLVPALMCSGFDGIFSSGISRINRFIYLTLLIAGMVSLVQLTKGFAVYAENFSKRIQSPQEAFAQLIDPEMVNAILGALKRSGEKKYGGLIDPHFPTTHAANVYFWREGPTGHGSAVIDRSFALEAHTLESIPEKSCVFWLPKAHQPTTIWNIPEIPQNLEWLSSIRGPLSRCQKGQTFELCWVCGV